VNKDQLNTEPSISDTQLLEVGLKKYFGPKLDTLSTAIGDAANASGRHARALVRVTRVLAAATIILAVSTVALVFVTAAAQR
jgi:hypothetical protein